MNIYTGTKPELNDADNFEAIIPLSDGGKWEGNTQDNTVNDNKIEDNPQNKRLGSEKILEMIMLDSKVTTNMLAAELGISTRAVEKQLKKLRESGIITRIGSRKEGSWKVNE